MCPAPHPQSAAGCAGPAPCTQHPAPCTLHPAPCTLRPIPCTLHPALCALHPVPCILHPAPCPSPCTLHPASYTLHPAPNTLHPTPLPVQDKASLTRGPIRRRKIAFYYGLKPAWPPIMPSLKLQGPCTSITNCNSPPPTSLPISHQGVDRSRAIHLAFWSESNEDFSEGKVHMWRH